MGIIDKMAEKMPLETSLFGMSVFMTEVGFRETLTDLKKVCEILGACSASEALELFSVAKDIDITIPGNKLYADLLQSMERAFVRHRLMERNTDAPYYYKSVLKEAVRHLDSL